jgi:uncharacterized protein (TIGR00369 family)
MSWADMLDMFASGKAPIPSHAEALHLPQIGGWERGKVWTEIKINPDLLNPQGALFGGYIAAVADELLGLAVLSTLEDDESVATSSSTMHYFRPMRAGSVEIEALVIHRGSRSAVSEVFFYTQGRKLAAKGSATQTILSKK